jgi:hypothetical protein
MRKTNQPETSVFPPLYGCAKLPKFRRGSGSPKSPQRVSSGSFGMFSVSLTCH